MANAEQKYTPPPRTGMEVFEMLPEGTLAELIDDKIYMSPAPNYKHQKLIGRLFLQMQTHVEENDLGDCILSPIDVYLSEINAVQPDIVFISKQNMGIVKDNKIKGVPDLLIEVLSPGNRTHDLQTKKELYEAFGVIEYFIVDPETKEVITYYLQNNKYAAQPSQPGVLQSQLLGQSFSF